MVRLSTLHKVLNLFTIIIINEIESISNGAHQLLQRTHILKKNLKPHSLCFNSDKKKI